jgi:predicted dehydrogenase
MDGERIRVGVIGAGVMGCHHARVYAGQQSVELVGVFDIDEARAEKLAHQYDIRHFASLDELMDMEPRAVSIATPTTSHREVAVTCAMRGVDMLLEKPIAASLDDAQAILEACGRNDVKLMVGFVERFNPVVDCIRKAIEGDSLISIDITRVGPLPQRISDVGVIIDLATHDIDLIRHITGEEIKKAHALCARTFLEREDSAMLSLETENGVMAHITVNWITPFKARKIQIATPEKFIEGDMLNGVVYTYSAYESDNNSYVVSRLPLSGREPLEAEIRAFLDYVRDGGESPVSGHDACRVLEAAHACLESVGIMEKI